MACARAPRVSCDVVLDTSLAWGMVEHRAQRALRSFLGNLGRAGFTVCYTEHLLFELAVTGHTGFRARSILSSVARCVHTGLEPAMAYRYKAAARRLGVNDVLIAVAARDLGAVLATGDWPMASFYMSLTGAKPIFIPLAHL